MWIVQQLFTRRDYDLLPEGFPAQLIEGCLVRSPAPTYGHQGVVTRLLATLCEQLAVDRVRPAPTDVILDDLNVYQPDVVLFRQPPPDDGRGEVLPLICFEVLSPTTATRDRSEKLPRLLRAGVREVWILDPAQHALEVHDARQVRRAQGEEEIRSHVESGLALVPARLFTPAS